MPVLMTISEPKEKARLALHNGNPETYVGQAFMLTAEWGVAPMNWPHFYRVITTDGNGERQACGTVSQSLTILFSNVRWN